jgi:hypothetical protein
VPAQDDGDASATKERGSDTGDYDVRGKISGRHGIEQKQNKPYHFCNPPSMTPRFGSYLRFVELKKRLQKLHGVRLLNGFELFG